AAYVLRRFGEWVEVVLNIKDDGFVDHAAGNGGEYIVHYLLIGSFEQGDGIVIHALKPPSRKKGNTRLRVVSERMARTVRSMSIRPGSARLVRTVTFSTSATRGSCTSASS